MGLTKNQWACRQEKMLVRKTPREQRIIVIEVVFAPPLILFYLNPAIKKINLKDNFLQSKKKKQKEQMFRILSTVFCRRIYGHLFTLRKEGR